MNDTDPTIEISIYRAGQDWSTHSSFFLGRTARCPWISHTRCNKFKDHVLTGMLSNNREGWVKVSDRLYVIKLEMGEHMEVLRQDSCFACRTSRLAMTRKAYEALLADHTDR